MPIRVKDGRGEESEMRLTIPIEEVGGRSMGGGGGLESMLVRMKFAPVWNMPQSEAGVI
jgi:hypothetical protein